MKLTVLGSGSKANGYVLQNDTEAIVLECGCPVSDCLRVLGYNTMKVVGALVTHEHGDHAKYVERYLESGIDVFCSDGTASAISYKGKQRPSVLEPLKSYSMGNFVVRPFPTQHDSAEPFGFLVAHPEFGTLVFATDTYYVKYAFDDLTNVMIECNYADDLLAASVASGKIPTFVAHRTTISHMSLRNCIELLRSNDLTKVSRIILVHLSENNGDPVRFKREVELATGKKVIIAQKGVEVPISKSLF